MTEQAPEQKSPETKAAGKGKATPSRKEAQAANVRPLVGDRSPEAKALAKEKAKAERAKMRAGQLSGDDRYLPIRERGPQKRFVRDLVDARYTVGEFLVPAMVFVLVLSFTDSNQASLFNRILSWASIGIMLAIVIDSIFIGRRIKKQATEKFGADKLESGLAFYGIVRATQLRVMRMPKPAVGPFLKK
jgi:branched-subunit amino acid transport protein